MRRTILAILAVLMAGTTASFAAEKLKVAVPQRGFWDSSWIEFGEAAGFFKEAGLEIEVFYTEGGAQTIATVASGSVDIAMGGWLGYWWLPVSSLPQVDFPTIQVTTQLPGASPDTITALVTAPLERQFGQIPALALMTSSSSFGISQVTLQFDLGRDIDGAAQDVQAAINAAASTLPRNLPYPPTYAKVNPADAPIITLALTSQTIALRDQSDLADTLMAQRLSEVAGVGRVSVQGGIRPAVRVQADLARLAGYGIGLEDLRQAIIGANVSGPKGALDGAHQSYTIAANDQLATADAYRSLVVAYRNSAPVLLGDVADVVDGLENSRVGAWYQGVPAVVIDIQRQPGSNVIQTVERVKAELPRLRRAMTIVGGLLVSQALTLYTTPVIYLLLDRLHRRLGGRRARASGAGINLPTPATG